MYAAPVDNLWEDDPSGTCWTPPQRVNVAEISPILLANVLLVADRQRVSIYSATAFDMESGGPIGQFEVAVDQQTNRAFGVFDHCSHDTQAAQTEGYVL